MPLLHKKKITVDLACAGNASGSQKKNFPWFFFSSSRLSLSLSPSPLGLFFIFFVFLVWTVFFVPQAIAERPGQVQQWWEAALAAREADDLTLAADYYERIYRQFRNSEVADEALWRAANLRKEVAQTDPDPDWGRVGEMFRRHSIDFPDSPHHEQVYLSLGISHLRMRFLREALTYFRLFEQRYPDSELVLRSRYWQAVTMIETGAVDEAINILRELVRVDDDTLRFDSLLELARAKSVSGDHLRALDNYHELLRLFPLSRFTHPEILFEIGKNNFAVEREKDGREYIFAFINLQPDSPLRAEAFFELAESRLRQDDISAARTLYAQVMENSRPGEREHLLSRYRLLEHLDAITRSEPELSPRHDPASPAGDDLYLEVIERFEREAIAQDARYGLFLRRIFRDDIDGAMEAARSFARNTPVPARSEIEAQRTGELLVYLVERFNERQEYDRVYHLYSQEHPHVVAYQYGRLRFLVGNAFEELGIYPQAAVIYYRALSGILSPEELIDLYIRRVKVYLELGDNAANEHLLAHLRRLYADDKQRLAEVYYLSARLRLAQERIEEAGEFLEQSLSYDAVAERRAAHLPVFFLIQSAKGDYSAMLGLLAEAAEAGWLENEELQRWYVHAGDGLRRQGRFSEAERGYRGALAEGLPRSGEFFQSASLHLGGILAERVRSGVPDDEWEKMGAEARELLNDAQAGPDDLLAESASQRLGRLEIDLSKGRMRTLFE